MNLHNKPNYSQHSHREKLNKENTVTIYFFSPFGCTVHRDVIQSFISPTNVQLICFEILKFTLKYTINAPTCFGFNKFIIREHAVCASIKLRFWCQLIYFVIKLFGHVATY
jgi:hypothetical protein